MILMFKPRPQKCGLFKLVLMNKTILAKRVMTYIGEIFTLLNCQEVLDLNKTV